MLQLYITLDGSQGYIIYYSGLLSVAIYDIAVVVMHQLAVAVLLQ